jgi:transposase InsO family protein
MSIKMPKNIVEERLRWVLPIINKEVRLKDIIAVCPHSERSLKRWLKAYRASGVEALQPKSTRPKTQPNETPIRIKEEIIDLRKKTKLCAIKLHWRLKKTGVCVPRSTIAKILKDEGLVRKYRVKRVKYKYIKALRQPGELIEIDVKYVPGNINGKEYFQYTAIDTSTKWRHLEIYDEQSSYHSICFLKEVIKRFPHAIQAIKTDNHSTFTNYYTGTNKRSDLTVKNIHALDQFCRENNIKHYLIDPGKPAQNGTVERSHREDEEKFYQQNIFKSPQDLKKKILLWNDYYNNLEHCSLNGKTPNEMLNLQVPKVLS